MKRLLFIFSALFFLAPASGLAVEYTPYPVSPFEETTQYIALKEYVGDDLRPVENDPVTEEKRDEYEVDLKSKYQSLLATAESRLRVRKNYFVELMNSDLAAVTAERRADAEQLYQSNADWYALAKAKTDRKYNRLEKQKRRRVKPLKIRRRKLGVRIKRSRNVIRKSTRRRVVKMTREKVRRFRSRIREIEPRIKLIETRFRPRQHAVLDLWREQNYELTMILNEDLTELAALLKGELAAIRAAWTEVFAIENPKAEDASVEESGLATQLFDEGTDIIDSMPVSP